LKKQANSVDLVGIGLCREGVALAHLSRAGTEPNFNKIDYLAAPGIDDMTRAINRWVKDNQLKDATTHFVLAAHQADSFLTEAPEVADAELTKAMRWKVKDMIDYDINEAVVDCFAIPGQRERGRQPMAYVVTAAVDVLKAYVTSVESSQLDLHSIDIPAMAQRNLAAQLPEDKSGVALLVLDEKGGLLTLTKGGELYLSRDLEYGYGHFAQQTLASVDDGGLAIEGMPPATQSTLDQIVLEVQRSIDYYERYFAHPPINSLVIAPTPRVVVGMVEYMASQLGMRVRELDLNVLLNLQTRLEREVQSQCIPAIGAALRVSGGG
jgi:MSHA biogenesis protein MshI